MMRFTIVFVALFVVSNIGIGYADDLETKLENASKPGSPEYEKYLKKKAEQDKVMLPLRAELLRSLKDEGHDPSEAIAFARYQLDTTSFLEKTGLSSEDQDKLLTRLEKVGKTVVDFLNRLDEKRFHGYIVWRYALSKEYYTKDKEAYRHDQWWWAKDPEFWLAARGINSMDWLPQTSDRDEAIEQVHAKLKRIADNPPSSSDPPFCQRIWENTLLDSMYLSMRWVVTAEEAGMTQQAYDEWRTKSKAIAKRDVKDLLAELKALDTGKWKFDQFAKDRLLFLLTLVTPKEAGTTGKQVEALLSQYERRAQGRR